MLAKYVRYQIQNSTGVAFGGLAGDSIVLTGAHDQFTVATGLFCNPPTAQVPINAAATALANGAFLTSTVIDTTTDGTTSGTRKTTQSDFILEVAISNVPAGNINVYMQSSEDNVAWAADGIGQLIGVMTCTATGVQGNIEAHGR